MACVNGHKKIVSNFVGTVSTSATELSFKFTGRATVACSERVEVYDLKKADWTVVSDQPSTTAWARTVVALKNDAGQYVDPSTGAVKIRVTYYGLSFGTQAEYDWLEWQYIG